MEHNVENNLNMENDTNRVLNFQTGLDGDSSALWPTARIWAFLDKFKEIKVDRSLHGNLKKRHWEEICHHINKSSFSAVLQDVQQMKNKLDNLKKKFRVEKAKQNSIGEFVHTWEFYNLMYDLFGSSGKFIGIPNASDSGQRSMQNQSGPTTPLAR
ncbi:hypothetical protein R1flu_022633 [Riccia fluitans]|uniref:Myb/SANT-like DNA-binding domain-containing protein n=1 Tax=Riccia fluitans TaxID=41844 RepID=A0ABD1XPT9_9MARC